MFYTLVDYLTATKGWTYVVAGILLASFVPFWRFLVEREPRDPHNPVHGG